MKIAIKYTPIEYKAMFTIIKPIKLVTMFKVWL